MYSMDCKVGKVLGSYVGVNYELWPAFNFDMYEYVCNEVGFPRSESLQSGQKSGYSTDRAYKTAWGYACVEVVRLKVVVLVVAW